MANFEREFRAIYRTEREVAQAIDKFAEKYPDTSYLSVHVSRPMEVSWDSEGKVARFDQKNYFLLTIDYWTTNQMERKEVYGERCDV